MERSIKAIEGKNGFLFLGGPDSNLLVPHLIGERRISRAACAVHSHNAGVLSRVRKPHMLIIVPEAHVMREDLLPDGIQVIPDRPVAIALPLLGEAAVYPLEMLRRMQGEEGVTVYTGHDSHWTAVAAYEAYRRLRPRLGRQHELTDAYDPSHLIEAQDLRSRSAEEAAQREQGIRFLKPNGFEFGLMTGILNNGGISIAVNAKGQGRCLAFGTSFSSRLVPAYASDFREVVYCYGTSVDEAVLKMVNPDAVIVEMPERFVHFPSISVEGSSLASAHLASREEGFAGTAIFQPDRLPPDLAAFAAVVNTLCDRAAAPGALVRAIIAIDRYSPAAARRTASTVEMGCAAAEPRTLRALVAGAFRRPDILGRLFDLVDGGALRLADADALPDSEMGLLTSARLMISKGLRSQARDLLQRCEARFGRSPESAHFLQHIGV